MAKFPARVHILLASEARTAVAIRRGPSKTCCTVEWDRRKDTFRVGQWVRHRIYERRCDLSPDGMYLIYFALNGKWESKTKVSWTAISRVPFLNAIGLWSNGNGWCGGGMFLGPRAYWINHFCDDKQLQGAPGGLKKQEAYPFKESFGGECPGVYYQRLQRDGWTYHGCRRETPNTDYTVFTKPLPKGWVLEKRAYETIDHPPGKGCYFDRHRLLHAEKGLELDYPDWEWAELDGKRLVWVEKGVLHAARLGAKGLGFTRTLFDFNPMEFERLQAPY